MEKFDPSRMKSSISGRLKKSKEDTGVIERKSWRQPNKREEKRPRPRYGQIWSKS